MAHEPALMPNVEGSPLRKSLAKLPTIELVS
jgi:hypothetical protein